MAHLSLPDPVLDLPEEEAAARFQLLQRKLVPLWKSISCFNNAAAEEWRSYAIEVNLRKGGTTRPYLTLQFLTDGAYDPGAGVFTALGDRHKSFVASDKVQSPLIRAFTPDDLFDIVARHGLHFDHTRQIGVVFHMLGGLGECGRAGLTAVGNSPAEADAISARAVAVLEEETEAAVRPHPVPARALPPGTAWAFDALRNSTLRS